MILQKDKNSILGAKCELVNTLLIKNEKLEVIKGAIFTLSHFLSVWAGEQLWHLCRRKVSWSLQAEPNELYCTSATPALFSSLSRIHWTHARHLGKI